MAGEPKISTIVQNFGSGRWAVVFLEVAGGKRSD
jgi:hypothetical protein